jgi:hypothetical protein
MTEFNRTFNESRKAQGFRSQEHLDAFFRHFDHQTTCPVCSAPGPAYWSEADASWQPTLAAPCEEGRAIDLAAQSYSRYFNQAN